MDRDEILEKSRQDYKKQDEMMADTLMKASGTASVVGLVITLIIYALEAFIFRSTNLSVLSIFFAMEASKDIVLFSKLKAKKHLIIGILSAILAILLIVVHFIELN